MSENKRPEYYCNEGQPNECELIKLCRKTAGIMFGFCRTKPEEAARQENLRKGETANGS